MLATLTIDFIGSTGDNHSDKYFIVFLVKLSVKYNELLPNTYEEDKSII